MPAPDFFGIFHFLKVACHKALELFQTNHLPTNHRKISPPPPPKKKEVLTASSKTFVCLAKNSREPRSFFGYFPFGEAVDTNRLQKSRPYRYPKIHMNQDFAVNKPNSGVLVSCRNAPFRGISLDFSKIRWESRSCCYHLRVFKGFPSKTTTWILRMQFNYPPKKLGIVSHSGKPTWNPPHQKGWVLEDGRFPFAKRSGTKISHSFQLLAFRWHTIFWCLIHCKNWRKRYH